ncbi:GGGtGRT protein [Vibrio lentus]|nr:GGGtGRT protein [Vibrio lentus]
MEQGEDQYCLSHNVDPKALVMDTQPVLLKALPMLIIRLAPALALFRKATSAGHGGKYRGEGLQAFTKPGSVNKRQVGIGHGALAATSQ